MNGPYDMTARLRVHVHYVEPSGWKSPPVCWSARAEAESYVRSVNRLSGPDAAKRRTWRYEPCDCGGPSE